MEHQDDTLKRIVTALFRLIRVELDDARAASMAQFVKFCLVGVSNTAVAYGVNVLVLACLQGYRLSWDYIAGNTVAFLVSVLWSFYWNSRYVFKIASGQKRDVLRALLKTYVSYGFTGIILNNILSYVWIDCLSIPKYVAPLINIAVSTPINYFINKRWAFRAK